MGSPIHREIFPVTDAPGNRDNLRPVSDVSEHPNQIQSIHSWDVEFNKHEIHGLGTKETEPFVSVSGCQNTITRLF